MLWVHCNFTSWLTSYADSLKLQTDFQKQSSFFKVRCKWSSGWLLPTGYQALYGLSGRAMSQHMLVDLIQTQWMVSHAQAGCYLGVIVLDGTAHQQSNQTLPIQGKKGEHFHLCRQTEVILYHLPWHQAGGFCFISWSTWRRVHF